MHTNDITNIVKTNNLQVVWFVPIGSDNYFLIFFRRNISGQEFGGMYCVVLIVRYIALSLSLLGMGLQGVLVLFSLDHFIAV